MLLPSPAAALAVVLPPHQHIATGAIQRRWDGRIDIVLSDGARELDPALVARLDHLGRKRFLYANTGRLETLQRELWRIRRAAARRSGAGRLPAGHGSCFRASREAAVRLIGLRPTLTPSA